MDTCFGHRRWQLDLARSNLLLEHRFEFATELHHEYFAWQQAGLLELKPSPLRTESTGRDEHMQMDVLLKRLVPSVQGA